MKIKQFLLTGGIAAALALGVGLGVGESAKASEVRADTAETTFYIDVRSSLWGASNIDNVKIKYSGTSAGEKWIVKDDGNWNKFVFETVTYVKYSIVGFTDYTKLNVLCWDESSAGNSTVDIYPTSFGANENLIVVGSNGSWGSAQPVTFGKLDVPETIQVHRVAVPSDAEAYSLGDDDVVPGGSYGVPDSFYKDYYSFDGWFLDEECETEMTEAITVNAETSVYAKLTRVPAVEGTIKLDLGYAENCSTWGGADTNFAAVLLADGWNRKAWTSYVHSAEGKYYVELPYSIGYEPEKVVIVRYPGDYTESQWEANQWPDSKWQSSEFNFCTQFALTSGSTIKDESDIAIDTGESGEAWSRTASLNHVQMNGEGHTEYYSEEVYLVAGNAFKVFIGSEAFAKVSFHKSIAANFSQENPGDDIQILVDGTYCIYFDTYKLSFYVTTEKYAAADVWGEQFLEGMVCDGNGNITSDNWSDLADSYALLPATVKGVFLAIAEDGGTDTYAETAVKRYDYIIKKYGTSKYNDFMGRGFDETENPKGIHYPSSAIRNGFEFIGGDRNMILIIVTITATAALLGSALLVLKKRKNHK